MSTNQMSFNRGYYCCGDDVMNFINSLDTSGMSARELRSEIFSFILERKPVDATTRFAYQEENSLHTEGEGPSSKMPQSGARR